MKRTDYIELQKELAQGPIINPTVSQLKSYLPYVPIDQIRNVRQHALNGQDVVVAFPPVFVADRFCRVRFFVPEDPDVKLQLVRSFPCDYTRLSALPYFTEEAMEFADNNWGDQLLEDNWRSVFAFHLVDKDVFEKGMHKIAFSFCITSELDMQFLYDEFGMIYRLQNKCVIAEESMPEELKKELLMIEQKQEGLEKERARIRAAEMTVTDERLLDWTYRSLERQIEMVTLMLQSINSGQSNSDAINDASRVAKDWVEILATYNLVSRVIEESILGIYPMEMYYELIGVRNPSFQYDVCGYCGGVLERRPYKDSVKYGDTLYRCSSCQTSYGLVSQTRAKLQCPLSPRLVEFAKESGHTFKNDPKKAWQMEGKK